MSNPQQPEIGRSRLGEIDQEGRRIAREEKGSRDSKGNVGKVPEENRPGHRPERDQDKPPPV